MMMRNDFMMFYDVNIVMNINEVGEVVGEFIILVVK